MFGKHFVIKFSINCGLHPNILLYHEIGANMNKLIINWSFILQQPCHNVTIVKKDYKGLHLMVFYL